ncbi:unnamed protein product [Rangifer tarandus platyrhynchus]|uniref:Uncharacterized protein n=1 Tax=Rangifer tarandus platyrhynchus TaxID=3082113 RepID=A0ABN8Z0L3_RANTA|nr:unnamed protein product [Rangifer tarandus platyrhynchus]
MGQVQRKADRGRGPIWAGPTASWTLGHQSQAPRKWPCLRWPLGALSLTLIGTPGPQVHPPQDTDKGLVAPSTAGSVDISMFPGLPAAPSVRQGWGPEISTGADEPGRPGTLEQGAGTQQAASTATSTNSAAAANPAGQPPRSAPAPRGLQGSPCGRRHHVQAHVTRGAEGSASGLQAVDLEPTGARAGCAGRAGASHSNRAARPEQTLTEQDPPRGLRWAGVGRDQLPRRGQEQDPVCDPTPLVLPLPPTRALGLGSGRWSLGSGASQIRDDDDPVSTLSLRLQNSLEGPASWPGPARIWGMDKPLPSPRRPRPRPRPAPLPPGGPGTRPNCTVSADPADRPGGGPGAAAAPARGGPEMA